MTSQPGPAGTAGQQIARDVALFNPAEQVFQAMLDGWRNQQLSRNLAFTTIARREQVIQRFRLFTGEDPWSWAVGDVDEFFMELRAVRSASHSTLLAYQNALRLFLGYLTDPAYGWEQECTARFGTHPVQVCHEWNTAVHVQEASARPRKRPLTRDELQEVRPAGTGEEQASLWPTERSGRVSADSLTREFTLLRTGLGLADGIDFHSLRRSYVTHLIEDGYDALFVQQQVGHEHSSTTALYTGVSSDYRTRTLRAAMTKMAAEATGTDQRNTP